LEEQLPKILVCAGRETSGAVCRALEVQSFVVRPNPQPGIPTPPFQRARSCQAASSSPKPDCVEALDNLSPQ